MLRINGTFDITMDTHYSDEFLDIPFIDEDGVSGEEDEEDKEEIIDEVSESACVKGNDKSSMDIAPTLIDIFDAVVGQDTLSRKEIVCKMEDKEAGIVNLDDEKPEADKSTIPRAVLNGPMNPFYSKEDIHVFEQNMKVKNHILNKSVENCEVQTSPLSQSFDKRTSWTESMSGGSDCEIENTGKVLDRSFQTNSDDSLCLNNNSSSIKPDRTNNNRVNFRSGRPASAEILLEDDANELDDGNKTDQTTPINHRKSSRINPPIPFTLSSQNAAMSPCASPHTTPPGSPKLTRVSPSSAGMTFMDRKVQEILDTERNYVNDLGVIIQFYLKKLENDAEKILPKEKYQTLFCNLEEIYEFNKDFLEDLEQCNNNPVYLAECFLEREDDFNIYTKYCTNYPKAVEILTECAYDEAISEYLRGIQRSLNHGLPLGAYLLKPVQRILKYHLLFQDMYKHFNQEQKGYNTIGEALECMTDVAKYINEMKRKHEAAVRKQEIQSQLHGWQENLTSYGELVLEDVFKMQGARGERFLYLFEKGLFICKKEDEGLSIRALIQIYAGTHLIRIVSVSNFMDGLIDYDLNKELNSNLLGVVFIGVLFLLLLIKSLPEGKSSNLMLIESIPKAPLSFNVVPFDQPSIQYTITAKSMEQKKTWTHELKRLILENYQSNIPDKVKELILKATTPETETDKTPPSYPETNLSRTRKERKSGRRNKRRNSEPLGKQLPPLGRQLQRGQKQVKAAVENFITGMKRPDLSKLGMRPVSEIQRNDGVPEKSVDDLQRSEENLTEVDDHKEIPRRPVDDPPRHTMDDSPGQPMDVSPGHPMDDSPGHPMDDSPRHSMDDSPRLSVDDSPIQPITEVLPVEVSPIPPVDEFIPESKDGSTSQNGEVVSTPRSLGSFKRAKESNRDSGIGSMTLTETTKADTDDQESSSLNSPDHSKDKLVQTKDDIEEIIEGMESPDELEILENLSEEGEGPSEDENESSKSLQQREFQLRRNIKEYRRRLQSGEDIWERMAPGAGPRGRSCSHSVKGSYSMVKSLPNTPVHKSKLSRAVSEDSRLSSLISWPSQNHSYSDPNITDLEKKTSLNDDEIFEDDTSEKTVDSSASSLCVEKPTHSSSNDDLLVSLDNEFKRLERKYSVMEYRDSPPVSSPNIQGKQSNSADLEESVSSEGTACLPSEKSASAVDELKLKVMEVSSPSTSHRVFSLARRYSRLSKEDKTLVPASNDIATAKSSGAEDDNKIEQTKGVPLRTSLNRGRKGSSSSCASELKVRKRSSKSDPFAERDSVRKVVSVSKTEDGRDTVLTNQEGSERLVNNITWRERFQRMGPFDPEKEMEVHRAEPIFLEESADEEEEGVFFQRSSVRQSVRDVVKRIEVKSSRGTKPVKSSAPIRASSVRQRLKILQDQSQAELRPAKGDLFKVKSVQERKRELEQWVHKPHNFVERSKKHSDSISVSSECSDSGMVVSGVDDRSVTSSRASSRRSSFGSNSVTSLRFGPPLVKELLDSTDWGEPQDSTPAEQDSLVPLQLKSLRQRLEELQLAASKPVPKTKPDPLAEIRSTSAQTTDLKSFTEVDKELSWKSKPKTSNYVPNFGLYYGKPSATRKSSVSSADNSSPTYVSRTPTIKIGRTLSGSSSTKESPTTPSEPLRTSTPLRSSLSLNSYLENSYTEEESLSSGSHTPSYTCKRT